MREAFNLSNMTRGGFVLVVLKYSLCGDHKNTIIALARFGQQCYGGGLFACCPLLFHVQEPHCTMYFEQETYIASFIQLNIKN